MNVSWQQNYQGKVPNYIRVCKQLKDILHYDQVRGMIDVINIMKQKMYILGQKCTVWCVSTEGGGL